MYLLLNDWAVEAILQLPKDCMRCIILDWQLATVVLMACPKACKVFSNNNKNGYKGFGGLEEQVEHDGIVKKTFLRLFWSIWWLYIFHTLSWKNVKKKLFLGCKHGIFALESLKFFSKRNQLGNLTEGFYHEELSVSSEMITYIGRIYQAKVRELSFVWCSQWRNKKNIL